MKTSFIIPARAEKDGHVEKTLRSIYENATGDFEVIVGFDGGHNFIFEPHQNLKIINFPSVVGIKTNINTLAACASGKYLFKLDAHCAVSKGIDEILQKDMQDDWIIMPRFKILTPDWQIQLKHGKEEFYDYFYLCCPFTDPKGFRFKAGGHWGERTIERLPDMVTKDYNGVIENNLPKIEYSIDETPQIHGSGWFMTKDRFFELGGYPLQDSMGHAQEPLWLALRNQLEGGRVVVNKNCWYAHMHQSKYSKGFTLGSNNEERTYNLVAEHFMKDPRMEAWLEKNMPMPTWPEDWRERLHKYQNE